MGCEVKRDIGGQVNYDLWGTNVKTGKYFPGGCWGQISCTFLSPKVIVLGKVNQLESMS